MPLFTLVLILVLIGVGLWFVTTYIPMDEKIKKIIRVVVIVATVLWLLSVFGILPNVANIHVGN